MSMTDGRLTAWAMAIERLEVAAKIRSKKDVDPENLPDLYWGFLAEANVCARLSLAATEVGFLSGDWLVRREEDREESRRIAADVLGRKKREDDNATD